MRRPDGPIDSCADFTSELPFASFSDQVLVQKVSHENDLIFVNINIQVTYIVIRIVFRHKHLFCHRGKSQFGIGLFVYEMA